MQTDLSSLSCLKDELIFREGDEAEFAYVIEQGQIEIFLDREGVETPLKTIGVGEFFGEMAIVDGKRRSASARALTHVRLTLISKAQVQERMEKADPVVRLLMGVLIQRIRDTNKSTKGESSVNELSDIQSQTILEKIKFEAELLRAIENRELILHYQPIVHLEDRGLIGFEALVRWNSPSRGLVRPDLFMGIAEETSLIIPIGTWVIDQAIADLAQIKNKFSHIPDLYVSINVSGRQFQDTRFIDILEKAVSKHGAERKNIRLEITERILLDGAIAIKTLEKLSRMGYRILLDDFGTGYSSLSYLSDLPIDIIKIDQSFVRKMFLDPKAMSLCRCIAGIAKDLELAIVAEGIETPEHAGALKDLGCFYGQGYLFAKPLALDFIVNSNSILNP